VKRSLIYPITILTDNLITIVDITVFYFIWKAIYNGENIFEGITQEQIITYIIIARMLYQLLSWGINSEISRIIRNGDIIIELTKPIRIWYSKIFL